ncbi:hypothetical protein R9X47_18220 [Wukongibacter baidiensis]|uniref:hypothetical protein n=1 Tax=Wukongibacter baidiensis TaxID=1723361 RepID=UPI003D7FC7C3
MMTESFLWKIALYIESQVEQCKYVLDGNVQDVPIYSKEVDDKIVKVSILLDENVEGNVTEFKLFAHDGQMIKQESCNIIKGSGRGLFKTFNIAISEVI